MSIVQLLIVYAVALGAPILTWLVVSLTVAVLVRSPLRFDFKYDLMRKHEAKRVLPSGRARLSMPYVIQLMMGDNCVQAVFLYRVSHFLSGHRARGLAEGVHALAKVITHADISPHAEIGRGIYLYHGMGVVVGKGTRIGERVLICQGVTLGGGPQVGDDVSLWAGAKVIGKVTVGDRAEVGANAVVVEDVPPDHIAVGVPATRLISRLDKVEATVEQR